MRTRHVALSCKSAVLAGFCLAVLSALYPVRAQIPSPCEQAGEAAEQKFGLPQGLLVAIGRVESGRWDAERNRVVPWPWSIDVDGQGRLFDSAAEVVRAASAARESGRRSIDAGCFQISLLHHPDAFATLEEAFDPPANASYAAQFLLSLWTRFGNWRDAVAAYHSATPELGEPYRDRVFATLGGEILPIRPAFSVIAGVRVWHPGSPELASDAAVVVHVPQAPSLPLPRVIAP